VAALRERKADGMRRVIGSTLVSLDGVIGDPTTWANEYFDEEAGATSLEQLRRSDGMLMGRNTYVSRAAAMSAALRPKSRSSTLSRDSK
jgi:hypothetical protein